MITIDTTRHPTLDDSPLLKECASLSTTVARAFDLMIDAHAEQTRTTGGPYAWHPFEVAHELINHIGASSAGMALTRQEVVGAVCIALLHDTVEDTGLHYSAIEHVCGQDVALGVYHLSDMIPREISNRAFRIAAARAKLATLPALIQAIKVIDMLCNVRAPSGSMSPEFVVAYREEKRAATDVIGAEAQSLVPAAYAMLCTLTGNVQYTISPELAGNGALE